MFDEVKSSELSVVRRPEIRTEVDTQEFKTERTIKLSKADKDKANMVEVAPGDKVLTPRPYKPGKPAKSPVAEDSIQK